ncbi:MAG: hypothetical protein FWF11_02455, partial [Coriobacteriia bacterium]|nr:hypothetical protein [Coriobacteriia bacterium]
MFPAADDAFMPNETSDVLSGGIAPFSTLDIRPEATSFSAGGTHSLAIRTDGTLWSWGQNNNGKTGLGATLGNQAMPAQVGTDTDWTMVNAGHEHSLAIRSDGTLWAWGLNQHGRTGLGTTTGSQATPVQVGTDTDWTVVSAGMDHSLAAKSDGTLWAWGSNSSGRTGLGTTSDNQLAPAQVGTATNWSAVTAGGNHSVALQSDGTLWSWGANTSGQTGLGIAFGNQLTPAQVGTATNCTQVSAAANHALAVRSDGTLWAWGSNGNGRTGLGTTTGSQTTPAQVGTATNWTLVSAGNGHSHAIRADGTLWAWGWNGNGRTGLDTDIGEQDTPAQVGSYTDWILVDAASSGHHSLGIRRSGDLWSWGQNNFLQLGLNDYTERLIPNLIGMGFRTGLGPPEATVIATLPDADATDINEINTTHLTVFFDHEMNPAVMGTITLDNGATVNLSQGIWRASTASDPGGDRGNNSVLTVPLVLLASDTLHEVTVSDFVCAENGELMIPYSWTFTTGTVIPPAEPVIDLAITKNLLMPEGTVAPETNFEFTIVPHSLNGETSTAELAQMPNLSVDPVAFNSTDIGTLDGDTITITRISDFLLGSDLPFSFAGLFVYRISERNDTFSNTEKETMLFDPTIYQ